MATHKTIFYLFGVKRQGVNLLLPINLKRFSEATSVDVETLINSHTIYPLIAAFESSEYASKVRSLMVNGGSNSISGIFGSRNIKIKYCPCCVVTDIEEFGEAYWHRSHNIPMVTTCVLHQCDLEVFSPDLDKSAGAIYPAQALNNLRLKRKSSNQELAHFDKIILEIVNGERKFTIDSIISLAKEKKYLSAGFRKFLSLKPLTDCFNEFVSTNYPSLKGHGKLTTKHLSKLLDGKNSYSNFYTFIILDECLRKTPVKVSKEDLIEICCVNKFCSENGKKIGVASDTLVVCSCCGMTHSIVTKDSKRITVLKDHGRLFCNELHRLYNQGVPEFEISKRLNVQMIVVERLLAEKFNVFTDSFVKKRDEKRIAWLEVLRKSPKSGILELAIKHKGIYRWLQANDNAWLLFINKRNQRRIPSGRPTSVSDETVLINLKRVYEAIDHRKFDRRISKEILISGIAGIRHSDLSRFPEAQKFVLSVVENNMEFRKRRIRNLVESDSRLLTVNKIFMKLSIYDRVGTKERAELTNYVKALLAARGIY